MKTSRTLRRLFTLLLLAFGLAATPGHAGAGGGPPPAQTVNFQSDGTVAHQFFPPGIDDEGEPTPGGLSDTLNLSPAPTLTANFATDKVLVFTFTAPPGKQIRVTPVGVGTRLSFQFRTQASISGQFSPGTLAPPVWENGQGALPASLSPAQLFYTAADSNLASFMVLPVTGSFSFTKLTVTMTLPPEAVASFANHPLVQTDAYFDAFGLNTDSGPAVTFETLVAPTVTTPTHADLTEGSATLGGNVTASGTSPITQRGIVFSATLANDDPTSLGAGVTNAPDGGTALGVFTRGIGGLSPGTSYSYAAYATNSAGTGFTAVSTFTTPATPTGPSTASITILESGADVVATGSGSINLTALTFVTSGSSANPLIIGSRAFVRTGGLGSSNKVYSGITGPSSFGSGGAFTANSGTGDMFGVIGDISYIQVPSGYVSQAPLAGTATWNGKTISSLGLTPGTYTYTWGSGGTAGSLTVQIGPVSAPNTAPTDITLSNASIPENNAPGATIGTLTATDADAGQTHTFTFADDGPAGAPGGAITFVQDVGNDNAAFTLTGNVLSINASADFEMKSSYTVRIRATDNGSPALSFDKTFTITITDVTLPQTITFAPLGGKTFGDADFTVSATGGASGQPVTFTASGAATVTGDLVHLTGAGSVSIIAHQAGAGDYAAAADVEQTFTVAKAAQTITFAPAATAQQTDAVTLTATGGASGEPVTFSLVSGPGALAGDVLTFTADGPVVVRASQAGNANYLAAADVDATITVGAPVDAPAVDDAVTTTTGGAALYPLANDGNPNATLVSVSDPLIVIDGRKLIVPAGFAGTFTYTTSDQKTANVVATAGTVIANAARWQGLLHDADGAIVGVVSASKTRTRIYTTIKLGTLSGRATFAATGGTAVTSLGTLTGSVNANGRVAITLVRNGETFTASARPARTSAAAQKHNIALAGVDTALVPGGGYIRTTTFSSGRIVASAKLPDGRIFTGSARVLDNGSFVLFKAITGTAPKAVIGGEFILADLTATDVTGELEWNLPAQAGLHSAGLSTTLTANGCLYTATAPRPSGSVEIALTGGDLAAPLSVTTTASAGIPANTAAVFTWTVSATKGTFSASIKDPDRALPVKAAGIYLPKSNRAWGFFPGTSVGGAIEMTVQR